MSHTLPDRAIRSVLAFSGHANGWDGRDASAANPASLVLATALTVEAASLGLSLDTALHANGNVVLTYEVGERRASIQCHPDGMAAAYVTGGGYDWDGEEPCVTHGERRYLIAWVARCLGMPVREPAAAFQVRRLDWIADGEGERRTFYVDTIVGRYAAWAKDDTGRMLAPGANDYVRVGMTAVDAMVAAQADFEHRILSAVLVDDGPHGARPSPDSVAAVHALAPLPEEDDPFFKIVLGGEVYRSSGGIPSIKHMHPLHMKPIFESVRGTAAADVMVALMFGGMMAWNNARHAWEKVWLLKTEVKNLKLRLSDAEGRLARDGGHPKAP